MHPGRTTIRDVASPFALPADTAERGPMSLLVVGAGTLATFGLPARGEVAIGRAQDCEVRIDEGSVSRRHAVLRLGPPLTIEDLGSANGTRVRDTPLTPGTTTVVSIGEPVQIGSVLVFVQSGATVRPRRVWTHGYFDARVEEECARGVGFALARIGFDGALEPAQVRDTLTRSLRAADVVGAYGPREYEIMLVDTGADDAARTIERVRGRLAALGATTRVGIACYPRDGRDACTLTERMKAMFTAAAVAVIPPAPLKGELREIERRRIIDALDRHGGNQTLAARALGISRRTLLNRLDEFAIARPRKRPRRTPGQGQT